VIKKQGGQEKRRWGEGRGRRQGRGQNRKQKERERGNGGEGESGEEMKGARKRSDNEAVIYTSRLLTVRSLTLHIFSMDKQL